jgi:hypothetical protein
VTFESFDLLLKPPKFPMIELSGLKHHVRMEEAFSIGLAGHEKSQWKS